MLSLRVWSLWLLALLLFACGKNQQASLALMGSKKNTADFSAETRGLRVTLGFPGRLSGAFTPMHLRSFADTFPVRAVYQAVVEQVGPDAFQPLLAEDWQFSADLRQVELKLRQGVRWHDGELFDADDFRFTLEFIASPGFYPMAADYYAAGYSLVSALEGADAFRSGAADSISGVELLGPYRIRLHYRHPNPEALSQLARIRLIAQHRWEGVKPSDSFRYHELLSQPLGTGPLRLVRYRPDEGVWLEAFPDYWGGTLALEQLGMVAVGENTAQALLLKGQLQIYRTSNWDPAVLQHYRKAGFQILRQRNFSIRYLGVNHRHPLLGQQAVRQALLRAIDRKAMVESLFYGEAEEVNSPFLPEVLPPPPGMEHYAYDPPRAIAELKGLGWQWREGRFYWEGKPVTLGLKIGDMAIYREMAPVIQHYLGQIGITVEVLSLDFATFLSQIDQEDFDMFLLGSHVGMTPSYGEQLFTRNTGSDFTNFYQNVEVDQLYRQAAVERDPAARRQMYQQLALIFNRELPWLFLLRWHDAMVVDGGLEGLAEDDFRDPLAQLESWRSR